MRDRKHDTAHRNVAEAKLGRKLRPGEDVDHLDDDKSNNSPANLDVKTHGAHSRTTMARRTSGLSKLRSVLRMTKEKKKLY